MYVNAYITIQTYLHTYLLICHISYSYLMRSCLRIIQRSVWQRCQRSRLCQLKSSDCIAVPTSTLTPTFNISPSLCQYEQRDVVERRYLLCISLLPFSRRIEYTWNGRMDGNRFAVPQNLQQQRSNTQLTCQTVGQFIVGFVRVFARQPTRRLLLRVFVVIFYLLLVWKKVWWVQKHSAMFIRMSCNRLKQTTRGTGLQAFEISFVFVEAH